MEHLGTNTWNELSYRRYENRKQERELDIFELEEENYKYWDYNFDELISINSYGLFENITIQNCFGVEDIFYLNYEE